MGYLCCIVWPYLHIWHPCSRDHMTDTAKINKLICTDMWNDICGKQRKQNKEVVSTAYHVQLCTHRPTDYCINTHLIRINVTGQRWVFAAFYLLAKRIQIHFVAIKRRLQRRHFIQQAPQRPGIRLEVVTIFVYPLWWHVVRSPNCKKNGKMSDNWVIQLMCHCHATVIECTSFRTPFNYTVTTHGRHWQLSNWRFNPRGIGLNSILNYSYQVIACNFAVKHKVFQVRV